MDIALLQPRASFSSHHHLNRLIGTTHVELEGLPRLDLAESFGVSFRFYRRERGPIAGNDTITDLETGFFSRQAAPKFPDQIKPQTSCFLQFPIHPDAPRSQQTRL